MTGWNWLVAVASYDPLLPVESTKVQRQVTVSSSCSVWLAKE
jgi:hypothetical protein